MANLTGFDEGPEYFAFLDVLNTVAAAPYLRCEFEMSREDAIVVVAAWLAERGPK
jgi:hypothetical protein